MYKSLRLLGAIYLSIEQLQPEELIYINNDFSRAIVNMLDLLAYVGKGLCATAFWHLDVTLLIDDIIIIYTALKKIGINIDSCKYTCLSIQCLFKNYLFIYFASRILHLSQIAALQNNC